MRVSSISALIPLFLSFQIALAKPASGLKARDEPTNTSYFLSQQITLVGGSYLFDDLSSTWPKDILDVKRKSFIMSGIGTLKSTTEGGSEQLPTTGHSLDYAGMYYPLNSVEAKNVTGKVSLWASLVTRP